MAELQKDFLFVLIKSMTTSEKRQFRLFVNRLGINTDAKFLLLFSEMDRMKEYDENVILTKKISTKQQLSNLKAHLYKQILVSLRMNPSHQNNRIQLREQLDFANILYQKGLYKQALKILDKTKLSALELDEKSIAMEIIDLEKVIESQYITRSIEGRADELIRQSKVISKQNQYTTDLSNLSLKLYSEMLSHGYVKNDEDRLKILEVFNSQIRKINFNKLKFTEKLWYYKAHVWKNQLLQDYKYTLKYAYLWVDLFHNTPDMILNHPVWYIKGNTYLLKILFLYGNVDTLEQHFRNFNETVSAQNFVQNENLQALIFLTHSNTLMNIHFIKGEFFSGTKLIPEIELKMNKFRDKIDEHHFMILYLKMAAMFFGSKKYAESIAYSMKIIESKRNVQEDLLFHTRILILMSKHESGNDEDYDEFIRSTLKFAMKMKKPETFHFESINFFKNLNSLVLSNKQEAFEAFDQKLETFSENQYYRRSLLYIDIHGWVKAKVQHVDVIEIIQRKVKYTRRLKN
ncbi:MULTISPECIES: hypothetical protein [Chryseobacterium]|uniref:Tetratricopeptide repeat protein n=1 Tax=Chryseobacterium camelliae TaxID=1265445 RepID=A0ABU0TGK9_9FLAO|nr:MULTISPECIES: hypothetical protein [Chryseobacterium]MDT3406004.1 hypothetical protein [Pseudacidovorax intermedius]MDQ1096195.1 hypothetical protein [Chryseobacterium camelliae]MDQ1100132.1 hypothetical protein [Chryseobacterium sp. SORGH_AS_1048]MDR6087475.1 hypothetical protein [Chryseobacterium sp. SORGH_AS_0909]MDR6131849.1 hypothetical protein [Chryseobacterium sp. SORGH_AS_1175]